jgi:hypothetical protein
MADANSLSLIIIAMITLGGILVAMTVGWWSSVSCIVFLVAYCLRLQQLSDRYGRIFIIGVAMSGSIIEELNFVLVSLYAKRLPGGPWFLLFGSVIEGSLGGRETLEYLTYPLSFSLQACRPHGLWFMHICRIAQRRTSARIHSRSSWAPCSSG